MSRPAWFRTTRHPPELRSPKITLLCGHGTGPVCVVHSGRFVLINTKHVTDRRKIRYESLDDLLADATRLSGQKVRRLGNWSPGQIYQHLADTINSSMDGFGMMFSAPVRWVLSRLMKRRFLTRGLPAGFKAPSSFVPEATSAEDGLSALTAAVARLKEDKTRALHPGFGRLTVDEWTQFHLRHAELHMSFLVEDD